MSASQVPYAYLLSRAAADADDGSYGVWRFDPEGEALLTAVRTAPGAALDPGDHLTWVGGYLLRWGSAEPSDGGPPYYRYRLLRFDPGSEDPLAVPPFQHGEWPKSKFWGRGADFGNPKGGHKAYDTDPNLVLIGLGSFLLNVIAEPGRSTFAVWNFDPNPSAPGAADPIPSPYSYTPPGSVRDIDAGDDLLPLNGYLLSRRRGTGRYHLWSFDPSATISIAHPPVQEGAWSDIDPTHELVPVGDYVLDWVPADGSYRLWRFDPSSKNPLTGPVRKGKLPQALARHPRLLGIQPTIPADETRAATPGTMDFMRAKIKKVVYYMLENRSFDHACGWLYEQGAKGVTIVGRDQEPFRGASTKYWNEFEQRKVYQSKYHDGKCSNEWPLEMFEFDPYHDNGDVLRQMFYKNPDGYRAREVPDMGGFCWSNGTDQVMQTFGNEQLPVLTGLARSFAVSDEWFCSIPSATDVNRAFSLCGSTEGQLNNFMSPPQYTYWPEQPHRASVWKTLWANGIDDFRIYNSTQWLGHVFSYQLFLEGQIPTVDASVQKGSTQYVAPIDQFYQDAKNGTLPAFSFLEPVWIGSNGTTSYHPGEDIVPGERQLNRIYEALRDGPDWEHTLLVVTFDEHGGIFDHVPPPYARNPWPNDAIDGFRFDLMGPRVPTILVSPWIDERVVFRTQTDVAYDATSFLATLLQWYGIPRARWFMGERANHAPSFEGVLSRKAARTDRPDFEPPFDSNFPRDGQPTPSTAVHDLHRHVAHQHVASMARGKRSAKEISALSHQVAESATDIGTLTELLDDLDKRLR